MELHEAIEKRRTVRVYKKPATEEQLRKIVLAGSKAPSGGNSQPWEFIIISDQNKIDQFAELKYELNRSNYPPKGGEDLKVMEERARKQKESFQNAGAVAVCCQSGQASAGWLAIENMSLAAVADGLGSGIVTYWGKQKDEAQKVLGLPEGYEIIAILKVGVPVGETVPTPSKRPEFSWLHKDRFGNKG